MPLLIAKIVLNLGDVFLFLFNDISVCTCCRRVGTATFLGTLAPKISLVLVCLVSLALVSGKLVVLVTRYVNGRSISELSPFEVLFFLLCGLVPLETL